MFKGKREGREGDILPSSIHQRREEVFLGGLVLVPEGSKVLKTMKYTIQRTMFLSCLSLPPLLTQVACPSEDGLDLHGGLSAGGEACFE